MYGVKYLIFSTIFFCSLYGGSAKNKEFKSSLLKPACALREADFTNS